MRYFLVSVIAVGIFYLVPKSSNPESALAAALPDAPIEVKSLQPAGGPGRAAVWAKDAGDAPTLALAAFRF